MSTYPAESMDLRFKLSRARPSGITGPFPPVCPAPPKNSKRSQCPRSAACSPAGTAALPKIIHLGVPLGTLSWTPAERFLTIDVKSHITFPPAKLCFGVLLGALARGAGIHCFRDLAAAGPPPKGVILSDVLTPANRCKIDL